MRDLARRQRRVDEERFQAVVQARREGVSWANIAEILEISVQAAHKRYKDRVDEWMDAHGNGEVT
jgi:DNA-directed RNA polymerase specialized sigma24 family protein